MPEHTVGRIYFGPADNVTIDRYQGLSLPENEIRNGNIPVSKKFGIRPEEFVLAYKGRGYTDAQLHFAQRALPALLELPSELLPTAEKTEDVVNCLGQILKLAKGLKDGPDSDDFAQALLTLKSLKKLL